MKKKLVAAAMAAVMAVSLTACGGSQPAETTAAATEAATEAASEEATEAASEEEKAEETEAAAAEFTTITPGKLMVGTSPDFAPYEFYHIGEDGTPQLAGFDVALAQRIADDLGLELQMVPMDFDGILMELQNGNIDLIQPEPGACGSLRFLRPVLHRRPELLHPSGRQREVHQV